ncbi:MAG: DEAD/DEAH box helicase [Nitrospiraceae bacterium]|nr:DEAD/DEAH box helicase [Nitrospiraceae bacterium]
MKEDKTHSDPTTSVHGFSPGFAALGLEASLLATLETLGYEEPTPIQREAIPPLLSGRDVLGQAATGTGKTAAFSLPLLQRIAHAPRQRPSALILVPTRELAVQVGEAVQRYGKELRMSVLAIYGGQAMGPQLQALRRGVDVVVATPGRALDHLRRQTLRLAGLQVVVLDEADEMLDMGFAEDLEAILEQTPATKQTALFSATMPPRIAAIARRHLKDPVEVSIAKEPVKAGATPKVQQTAYVVYRQHKSAALARVLDMTAPKSALVFCRTRLEVDEVTAALNNRGYRAEAIHGGMSQVQRDRVMQAFRSGQTELLVATDVAARGLDIPHVSHVINYDLPSSLEVYVHRIGRTGRAGREGAAITILEPREHRLLRSVEHMTKARITLAPVPSVADLKRKRLERTGAAVQEAIASGDLESFRAVVEALGGEGSAQDVAAAALKLVYRAFGGERAEEEIPTVQARGPEPMRPMGRPGYESPGRGRLAKGGRSAGMVRVYVGAGRAAGIRPGDLVGAITNEAGITSRSIGAIEVEERFSIVDVAEDAARQVIEALGRTRLKGQKVAVRVFRE